tara:strand:+ start:149 stop:739 length:591 start_codon:yes stop_codon:yes gene_type:complete
MVGGLIGKVKLLFGTGSRDSAGAKLRCHRQSFVEMHKRMLVPMMLHIIKSTMALWLLDGIKEHQARKQLAKIGKEVICRQFALGSGACEWLRFMMEMDWWLSSADTKGVALFSLLLSNDSETKTKAWFKFLIIGGPIVGGYLLCLHEGMIGPGGAAPVASSSISVERPKITADEASHVVISEGNGGGRLHKRSHSS